MNYRRLGKTGLEVSEVGFGAWGIGRTMWIGAEDKESLQALERAIELGVNFIDTALVYGDGHSEKLVGQTVRNRSETVYVATKVPPRNMRWPASGDDHASAAFPAEHIRKCTETSLRNLGLETIDVQQFHVWHDNWLEQGDWREAIDALKQEGKIRHFGVSINDHEPADGARARPLRLRRHRPGDPQRLRPEPRGRAVPARSRSTTSACSRASRSTRAA